PFSAWKRRVCWRHDPTLNLPARHIIYVMTPESNRVFTVRMEWRGRRGRSCHAEIAPLEFLAFLRSVLRQKRFSFRRLSDWLSWSGWFFVCRERAASDLWC